jgi:hypothetical protein
VTSAGAVMPGTISVMMLGRSKESLFETSSGCVEREGSRRCQIGLREL